MPKTPLRQHRSVLNRSHKRPRFTDTDRTLLVLQARRVRAWKQAVMIVKPDTLLGWHRHGFRLFWRRTSRAGSCPPRVHAICEQLLGSARRACLDHLLIVHAAHLRRVLNEYVRFFNRIRPHQASSNGFRQRPRQQTVQRRPTGRVISVPVLGGLHHAYQRGAYRAVRAWQLDPIVKVGTTGLMKPNVRLHGRWAYVYRAIDQDGQVVDVYFSKRRNAAAAFPFFERALTETGVISKRVDTDKAKCYPPTLRAILPMIEHRHSK